MGIAACKQQSAAIGLKRLTDPNIGSRDNIEYLPFGPRGGKPLLVFVALCLLVACARVKKKRRRNPQGGHSSEKTVIPPPNNHQEFLFT
jgi:hypothetical protein